MMRKKSLDLKTVTLDILFDLVGCALLAVAIESFSAPNNIAPGGVTGLSVMLNYLFDIPISALTFLFNVPLLIMAWLFLGHSFTLKTLKTVAILTGMLEIVSMTGIQYVGDPILAGLYGGVLQGIGVALVFMRSSTTGGTDIASRLIQLKMPGISVGKLILGVDACVLIAAAIVYHNIENAMYGLIAIFASTRLLDSILYGLDTGKVMMIMSRQPQEISKAVIARLGRGCTLLDGKGSYTMREQPVVLCVVRKSQYFDLKRLVNEIDPAAFMIALEASEIVGEGFKGMEESTKAVN